MTSFGKLFYGFLFVLVDIRFHGFDVLPDVLGYILIIVGLFQLAPRNANFAHARLYAIVLLVLSALDLFSIGPVGPGKPHAGLFGSVAFALYLAIAGFVAEVVLVRFICAGIAEMATAAKNVKLARTATVRWRLFFGTQLAALVFVALAYAKPSAVGPYVTLVVVAGLLAAILITILLRRADQALSPRRRA